MARINVSVPDSLKERMSALDDRVNWSEVAQAAFEREVTARTFKGDDMEGVIERLRASKDQYEDEERDNGIVHGREWAKRRASFKELKAIAQIDFGSGYFEEFDMGMKVDEVLNNDVRNEGPEASLWSDGSSNLVMPGNAYVEAFVEGAKEVWDEVSDKI
ncbi:hypothetical protein [uncultured Bradyrhizobium sp.]|jgi:hypothetical protein|uniref:hypothetical protein n=1 Tax=uncultured Bradyrhizobium sp. TaxID=199684 RepID=UPI0026110AC8|nr:hypothetical protein [uncultured Bradyrhizobium sp.]